MIRKFARMFAQRDLNRFPNDENGDILFGIWKRGGDLEAPRLVDFSLIFPKKGQADSFAQELASRGGEVEVTYFEANEC